MKWQKRKQSYFIGEVGEGLVDIRPHLEHVAPFGLEWHGRYDIYIMGSTHETGVDSLDEAMATAQAALKEKAEAMLAVANSLEADWEEWKP